MAMPILPETRRSWPTTSNGSLIDVMSLSARVATSAGSQASTSRTNSSPPIRASVSRLRTPARIRFETVEIEEKNRETAIFAPGILNLLLKTILEQGTVRELGEAVVHGKELEFLVSVSQASSQNGSARFKP